MSNVPSRMQPIWFMPAPGGILRKSGGMIVWNFIWTRRVALIITLFLIPTELFLMP